MNEGSTLDFVHDITTVLSGLIEDSCLYVALTLVALPNGRLRAFGGKYANRLQYTHDDRTSPSLIGIEHLML